MKLISSPNTCCINANSFLVDNVKGTSINLRGYQKYLSEYSIVNQLLAGWCVVNLFVIYFPSYIVRPFFFWGADCLIKETNKSPLLNRVCTNVLLVIQKFISAKSSVFDIYIIYRETHQILSYTRGADKSWDHIIQLINIVMHW